jgi:hypothetical protein
MAVDTAAALRRLQSGQTLTAAEEAALGLRPEVKTAAQKLSDYVNTSQQRIEELTALENQAGATAVAGGVVPAKIPSESNAQYMDRLTEYYKAQPQPKLTDAQISAGGEVRFIRTGKSGEGTYKIVYPTGTKFDAKGNPIVPKVTSVIQPTGATGEKPIGTPPAFIFNPATGKWEMPPKPTSAGNWVWDNTEGWINTTLVPGSSGFTSEGGPTLALNTFKNTLALFFGAGEMSQAWVDALYKVVAGYVNTGSTIDESLNLSLQDVRNNPALATFTKRFQGLYALQDRLAQGEAIEVPTIAEFFKSESAMGDVLRSVGLGELATQDFLGDVLGRGKSVLEVTNLINSTFKAIDNAPAALKADLQTYFPGVDRTSLAKALLTGKEGWQELDRKIRGVSVLSAAKSQGVNVSLASATDIADLGFDYSGALSGFETVKRLERGKMLGEISGTKFGQEEAVGATFYQNVKAKQDIEQLAGLERARFAGSSGRLASRSRAQGLI